MSHISVPGEKSTSAETSLLTALNNLTAGGAGTAIQKTTSTTFSNVTVGGSAPQVVSLPDQTTVTPNVDQGTQFNQRNTQAAGTLTIANPTGTPADGQIFLLRLKCTNAQTLAFGTIYRASTDIAFPSATTALKNDYLQFKYNTNDLRWDLIGKVFGF